MKPQNSPRLSRWFEIGLIAVVMATYLYAALAESHSFVTQWFIRDDAFYYFKVAQNISEGRGVTFDGVNLTNGYHPLWMLVCVPIFALARFNIILPLRVLVLVSGAISAATGILLFRLVGRTLSPPAAILAAAYWCFDRAIHYNVTMFGLETGLTALTMVAFLLAMANLNMPSLRGGSSSPCSSGVSRPDEAISATRGGLLRSISIRRTNTAYSTIARNDSTKILTLGLLAVAMVFSRLDTIFLAALAGAWILLRARRSIRYYLMFDITIIVSAAFISVAVRTGLPAYFVYTKSAIFLAALGLAIQIPAFHLFGLYSPSGSTKITIYYLRFALVALASAGIVALGLIGLSSAGQLSGLPRSALPVYAGLVLVGAGVVRFIAERVAGSRPAPARFADLQNWKRWLLEGLHFYGVLGGALAVYMFLNKILFGTFTPVSGQIKRWWGALQGSSYGNPISTLSGFLGLEMEEGLNAWGPIVYPIHRVADWLGGNLWLALGLMSAAAVLILATRPKRAARAGIFLGLPILLCSSVLQMFYYNGLGYAGAKDWYWVSQMLMFALLGALLFDLLVRPLRKFRAGRALIWAGTILAAAWMAASFVWVIIQRMPWGAERVGQPYMEVLPFLESNTEEGALIGMTGGGNIGYFLEGRTIVNMDGLINSYAYFRALQTGAGDDYLASIGLDYIFSNPTILENAPYYGQFSDRLEFIAEYGRKDLSRYRIK